MMKAPFVWEWVGDTQKGLRVAHNSFLRRRDRAADSISSFLWALVNCKGNKFQLAVCFKAFYLRRSPLSTEKSNGVAKKLGNLSRRRDEASISEEKKYLQDDAGRIQNFHEHFLLSCFSGKFRLRCFCILVRTRSKLFPGERTFNGFSCLASTSLHEQKLKIEIAFNDFFSWITCGGGFVDH